MTEASTDWSSPLDPAAITTPAIAERRLPVVRVVHEAGHGGWQFYDDVEPLTRPVVLPKDVLLEMDPSLAVIIDLPLGWKAIRDGESHSWERIEIGS